MDPTPVASTLVAVIAPALTARALRVCREGPTVYRGEERVKGGPPRSVFLIEVLPADARRMRADPLLATAWLGSAGEALAGAAQRESVALAALGSGRTRTFRGLEWLGKTVLTPRGRQRRELEPAPLAAAGAPRPAALERGAHRATDASRAAAPPGARAFWVPAAIFPRFLDFLASLPAGRWMSLRVRCGPDGAVVTGALSARTLREAGLALAVPLETRRLAGSQILYLERGIEVPAFLAGLAPPASAVLLRVEDAAVRADALDAVDTAALDLLAHRSRKFEFERAAPAVETTGGEDDPRSTAALLVVVRSLRPPEGGDLELQKAMESAFAKPEPPPETAPRPPARAPSKWLRHFLPRRLHESLRRFLDRSARRRLADPRAREELIARQRDALALLLRKLSGPDWQAALPVAPPLRKMGADEPASPWLNVRPEVAPVPLEFSLDLLQGKAAGGVFGVGERVYLLLEALYRQCAEDLLETGEHRRAAHVFSYLLGAHEQAAAALDAGGFPLEAATVYYHLARRPDKAARCLDRGGFPQEAARIWMDLGRWREAAHSWRQAANEAQATAAWRMVALKLQSEGKLIAAAGVLDGELKDRAAAFALLERAVFDLGPRCLDALELGLRKRVEAGDLAPARDLHERAAAAFALALEGTARRLALRRLAEWAGRAARLKEDGLPAIDTPAVRSAWLAAARAWARARDASPAALRNELDPLVAAAARHSAQAAGDPWLALDVDSWLYTAAPRRSSKSSTAVTESVLPARCSTLFLAGNQAIAGTEDGRLLFLDGAGRVLRQVDTRSARPVIALAVLESDLYCAVAERVYHFSLDRPADVRPPPVIPLQVERSLPDEVTDLLLRPDGRLLRISRSEARWVHPQHLQPLEVLHLAPEYTEIRSACANRRFTALLVARRPEEPEGGPTFAGLCFERSQPRPGGSQPCEVFPIHVREPRRLMFTDLASDDVIAIGEEEGVFLRSRRDFAVPFDLEASSHGGRLPHARAQVLRLPDDILIAYGDGSLERLPLAADSRSLLAPAPEGALDPLVGFELTGKKPREAWLLHRSGKLRRVPLAPPVR